VLFELVRGAHCGLGAIDLVRHVDEHVHAVRLLPQVSFLRGQLPDEAVCFSHGGFLDADVRELNPMCHLVLETEHIDRRVLPDDVGQHKVQKVLERL